MTTGTRPTHDFCWINLMSPEGAKARAFFASLLGWTYGEMPGAPGGRLIQVGGLTAGALMDLNESNMPPGIPPVIGVMVRVDDVDATVKKACSLGGKAEDAFDVGEDGRMAMLHDPCGAMISLWQPKKKLTADCDSHANGAPSWFETLSVDPARAAAFYAELFGWKVEEKPLAPGMSYTRFKLGDRPIGGAMKLPPGAGDTPSHWGTYFAVDDADATAARGAELGGKLCLAPQDIPGVGRFALLLSPQGVSFHIIQYNR